MRRTCWFLALSLAALLTPAAAWAHAGNPKMESIVRSLSPPTQGVSIQVLNRDDRFELTNRSRLPVVIYGYNDERYARLLPDGTVQVNKNSPAYYLNQDRFAAVKVPPNASATATPAWSTIDRTGRFEWHDHRMHYMGQGVPRQVRDPSKRQKVFDYSIPIEVGGRTGAIRGTLEWTPLPSGIPTVALIAGLVGFAAFGFAFAVVVNRRRRRARGPRDDEPAVEAW